MSKTINLNQLIDHTNLNQDASKDDIAQLVKEAKTFAFNSICIRPKWLLDFAHEYKSSAVISFPVDSFKIKEESDKASVKAIIGGATLEEKQNETIEALNLGAKELDPVIDLSKLESFQEELEIYKEEILKSKAEMIFLKPIFSCEILSKEELIFSLAKYSEYVSKNKTDKIRFCYKNSTGFIKSENPELLNTTSKQLITTIVETLDKHDRSELVSIKAAGGIRSKEDIQDYYELCHGRLSHIGTSSGVKIFS